MSDIPNSPFQQTLDVESHSDSTTPTPNQPPKRSPVTLLSLPPKCIASIIGALSGPVIKQPLTKFQYIERSTAFSACSDDGRKDLWNLATTCKAMRGATLSSRLKVIRKPISGLESWPSEVHGVSEHIKYLDLYEVGEPHAQGRAPFKDYEGPLTRLLSPFSHLQGLRVPGFPPISALTLKTKHLEYLEISYNPSGRYSPLEEPEFERITVDHLVITETNFHTFSRGGDGHLGRPVSGKPSNWASQLERLLAGIGSDTQLTLRLGECGEGEPSEGTGIIEKLAKADIWQRLEKVSLEVGLGAFNGMTFMEQQKLLAELPLFLQHLTMNLKSIEIFLMWESTPRGSYYCSDASSLERIVNDVAGDPIRLEEKVTSLAAAQRRCSIPDDLASEIFVAYAEFFPVLLEMRLEDWVATRDIDPAHTVALQLCGKKPIVGRRAKILREAEVDLTEWKRSEEDGWAKVFRERIKAVAAQS